MGFRVYPDSICAVETWCLSHLQNALSIKGLKENPEGVLLSERGNPVIGAEKPQATTINGLDICIESFLLSLSCH